MENPGICILAVKLAEVPASINTQAREEKLPPNDCSPQLLSQLSVGVFPAKIPHITDLRQAILHVLCLNS